MIEICLNINADEFFKQLLDDEAPLFLTKFLELR